MNIKFAGRLRFMTNQVPGMLESALTLEKSAVNVLDVNGNASRSDFKVNGYTNRYAMSLCKDVAGQLDEQLNLRNVLLETQ